MESGSIHGVQGIRASEVGKIIQAYHYGLVFDETDIKRIINTNLKGNVEW